MPASEEQVSVSSDDDDEDEIFFGAVSSKECLRGIQVINQELTTTVPVAVEEQPSVAQLQPKPASAIIAAETSNPHVPSTIAPEAPSPTLVEVPSARPNDPPASKLPTRIARPSRLRAPKSSV